MKINLGGITQVSTIDWYGRVAMIIYLRKCTFKCKYCQNHALLESDSFVDIEVVEGQIENARDFIDAVICSGGEPCLQLPQLEKLSKKAKELGLKFAIETNGSLPDSIAELCAKNILDNIFLDVKAPLSNAELYREVANAGSGSRLGSGKEAVERVRRTIEICKNSGVEFEVRTTVFRELNDRQEEIEEIARAITGCSCYAIQQGRPELAWSEEFMRRSPVAREELIELAKAAKRYVPEVRIRTKEGGSERV